MDDITREMLRAILDNPNNKILKVDCTMVITLRDKMNWSVEHEIEAKMETQELTYKDGDLVFTKPIVLSYTHRRYQ